MCVKVQGKLTTGCGCNGSEGVCADVVVCASVGMEGGESSDDSLLASNCSPPLNDMPWKEKGGKALPSSPKEMISTDMAKALPLPQ